MKKVLMLFLVVVFVMPFMASADGGIMPPPNYYVKEDSQKAVIVYDQGVETMIISVEFSGDAKDFGWVVPTPTKPEVNKSSDELFKALADLTKSTNYYPVSKDVGLGAPEMLQEKAVTVLETKKIDVYDIAVLEANDPEGLARWLKNNGYQYPENEAYILKDYIKKNWYFTAVKVSADFAETTAAQRLQSGHAVPLKFVFKSDKIVYPMKISSIQSQKAREKNKNLLYDDERYLYNVEGDTAYLKDEYVSWYYPTQDGMEVTLYVLADHKYTYPEFTTQYAGWLKQTELEKLAFVEGEPWIKAPNKLFLTKLYKYMTLSEMNDDLYLRQADNDKIVGVGKASGLAQAGKEILYALIYLIIWIISPIGIIFIIGSLMQFLGKSKTAHIVAWVMQILMFLINLIFVLTLTLLGMGSDYSADSVAIGVKVAGYLSVLIMIVVMIWQEIYKRKFRMPNSE